MISPHNRHNHRHNRHNHNRDDEKKNDEECKNPPGHVLLLTILDAMYPITTKLLERICSYAGPVLRIVIFRKKSVQAMIEFDSIVGAQRAKAALNGVDIYRGCCTIKVEYAKPQSLNVFKNDDNTRDFSIENRHHEGKFREPDAPPVGYDTPYGMHNYGHHHHHLPGDAHSSHMAVDKYGLPTNPTHGAHSHRGRIYDQHHHMHGMGPHHH
ncbi:Oidioi.mRNA.OKI2018_I69.XSR.g16055.t1.cds [Oikopleura dioica]|uniref:Oidioi.mRNA.OKI2018_I69.XSR.g16055.t1.cds n=1 Tax=Oikopleura dioica TaxID=34765 RepID=A0ABN7SET9_OIKDI|nr:Oidioi.mRNA.OKI2018_I69.XSR.g16055.t1.cds [Oikopleura dioica]